MKTILVVDDEEAMVSMVRDALTLGGYEVLEAGGGAEALRLEQAHAGAIDLLLTDIVMPDLSGPDLARKFAARRPRAKVLYMSAFSLVDLTHHTISVDHGVPILTKPFTVDALELKVHSLLDPSPFGRPARSGQADTTIPKATR